ncbi:MAG: hypothetical protein M3Y59_02440 [Myxococcota bacterium]|nr:hypothetical protein [Myxococcota bacterium]
MEPLISELLGRAFESASALEANAAMARLRDTLGGEHHLALSYEGVIPQTGGLEYLTGAFLPRLVYFLDCRGAKLPEVHGVFLSLFHGDRLYFLRVADLIDLLSRATGLSADQMVARYGAAAGG